MTVIRPSIKDVLCLEKIPIVLEESYETRLLPWVITCIRKRGRLLLGKNWDTAMQPKNGKDKYTVEEEEGRWSSSPRKTWKVCK